MMFFLGRGYREIAHDRPGYGRSARVADGHDMDHYADVKPRVNKGRSRAASGPCSEPACYGHCYPLRNWSGSFSVAAVSVFPISVQAVQPGDFHRLV